MHRSVLKNDDYIDFADDNTVEVMSVSGVRKAMEAEDDRAETYEVEVAGETVTYLKEWPGLTIEQIEALRSSKASSYNNTGGIPYTCLVDPHTLEQGEHWKGQVTAKKLMEAIDTFRETLEDEHGKGMRRKDLRKVDDAQAKADKAIGKGDYAKALKEVEKIAKKGKDWPEALQTRFQAMRDGVIEKATAKLDEIEALDDAKEKKKLLGRIKSKLRGTGLEERVKQLLAELAPAK